MTWFILSAPAAAIPASATHDDRDQRIRDALQGLTTATAAGVEAAARKQLEAQPRDPVAHGTLAGCLLFRAQRRLPEGRDGIPPPDAWDGQLTLTAYQEAWNAREAAPALPILNALYAKAVTVGSRVPEITTLLKSWPAEYFTAEVHRAIGAGLLTMAPRSDGEIALNMAELWAQRFGSVAEVRRQLVEIWWSGGRLDRALKSIDEWAKESPAGHWAVRRAEIILIRDGLEAGHKALAGLDAPSATELATLIAGAMDAAAARPALEALAAGAPSRPGARFLAIALGKMNLAPPLARQELLDAAVRLIDNRGFPEGAIALRAREKLGAWGDAEIWAQADLWRKMREWDREIATLKPLAAKADRAGKLDNGVTAGDYHFRVGRASFHALHYADAAAAYDRSAAAGKADPELWFHVYKNLAAQGRKEEGKAWLKKAAAWKAPVEHAKKARAEIEHQASASPGPAPGPASSAAPSPSPR